MNQTNLLKGAAFMVLAGICFAAANAITFVITGKLEFGGLGFKPQSDTFWQYTIATAFSLPFVLREGLAKLRTQRPVLHILRVMLSALGVQAFVMSVASGTPIWQVIALIMTSPIFVLVGAAFFLGENVTAPRWIAAAIGLSGATIVTGLVSFGSVCPSDTKGITLEFLGHSVCFWTTGLTTAMIYPVAAALLWAASSLLTKVLTRTEQAPTVTLWLLVLLTPINAGLSVQAGFELPSVQILGWLVAGGIVMMAAQYLLTWAYAVSDAAFVQPFDDLKLISNILIYGLAFGYWPEGNIWAGVALILAGSLYLLWSERSGQAAPIPA